MNSHWFVKSKVIASYIEASCSYLWNVPWDHGYHSFASISSQAKKMTALKAKDKGAHDVMGGSGAVLEKFREYNLDELEVPHSARPLANQVYMGQHGYTLRSPQGGATCLSNIRIELLKWKLCFLFGLGSIWKIYWSHIRPNQFWKPVQFQFWWNQVASWLASTLSCVSSGSKLDNSHYLTPFHFQPQSIQATTGVNYHPKQIRWKVVQPLIPMNLRPRSVSAWGQGHRGSPQVSRLRGKAIGWIRGKRVWWQEGTGPGYLVKIWGTSQSMGGSCFQSWVQCQPLDPWMFEAGVNASLAELSLITFQPITKNKWIWNFNVLWSHVGIAKLYHFGVLVQIAAFLDRGGSVWNTAARPKNVGATSAWIWGITEYCQNKILSYSC